MQNLAHVFVLLFSAVTLAAQPTMHYFVTGNPFGVWQKFTVTKIANGVSGCANANGCWQVNSGTPVNAAAALTQNLTLFQLPANGHVTSYRIKSAVACSGPVTFTTGLGTASTPALFLASAGYNLETAVSNTNVTTALPLVMGSDTAAAVNIVASMVATVSNVDQVANGCSYTVHVLWEVLPL